MSRICTIMLFANSKSQPITKKENESKNNSLTWDFNYRNFINEKITQYNTTLEVSSTGAMLGTIFSIYQKNLNCFKVPSHHFPNQLNKRVHIVFQIAIKNFHISVYHKLYFLLFLDLLFIYRFCILHSKMKVFLYLNQRKPKNKL